MDVIWVGCLAAVLVSTALACQVAHYVVVERRPWHHAIIPRTWREWAYPHCPLCWVVRACIIGALILVA